MLPCPNRYFSEAALDIYNCHHITFTGTTLEHNRGTGIVQTSYRGNTGGVSFGYNTLPSYFSSPTLDVSNSTFLNNSATAETEILTTDRAYYRQYFTGRGGALAVFSNESDHNLYVTISDCVFEENYAQAFGGGMYLLLGGFKIHHKILVQRNNISSNIGLRGGGGVLAGYFNDGPLLIAFVDCIISNNSGAAGGGIYVASTSGMYVVDSTLHYIYFTCSSHTIAFHLASIMLVGQDNLFRVRNSFFVGNQGGTGRQVDEFGAALAFSLFAVFRERSTFPLHEVTSW